MPNLVSLTSDPNWRPIFDRTILELIPSAADTEVADEDLAPIAYAILTASVKAGASDIHLEPGVKLIRRMRYRVDGVMRESSAILPQTLERLVAEFKSMAGLDCGAGRLPQSSDFEHIVLGKPFRIRVATLPMQYGEKLVARVWDLPRPQPGLDCLGFHDDDLKTIQEWMRRGKGLIVACGIAGTGTTTLLYAMLASLGPIGKKLVAVERGIEYDLPGMKHTLIDRAAGITFDTGLEDAISKNADIILVEQLFDLDTARSMLSAALENRIILTNFRSWDYPSILYWLKDSNIDRDLVASAWSGIVRCTLARRLCPACKSPHDPNKLAPILDKLRPLAEAGGYALPGDETMYQAIGCAECDGTGYRGRIGLHEVLDCNSELIKTMLNAQDYTEGIKLAVESGTKSLLADGLRKVAEGVTSIDDVLRVVFVPGGSDVRQMLAEIMS